MLISWMGRVDQPAKHAFFFPNKEDDVYVICDRRILYKFPGSSCLKISEKYGSIGAVLKKKIKTFC